MRARADQAAAIIWFRQDLRLHDHAALRAAASNGRPIVAVYILDDTAPGGWAAGGASRWWLHHGLASLAAALARHRVPLTLRRGPAADILPALLAETGAAEIHAGRAHEPWARAVEAELERRLPPGTLHLHRTATLHDAGAFRTKTGGIYGIYTPYARTLRSAGDPPAPQPAPPQLVAASAPPSEPLEQWQLLPRNPDWAADFSKTWTPGEPAAHRRLDAFVANAVHRYDTGRNLPGQDGTSMLSPHLHWGELSPNQVWHAATQGLARRDAEGQGLPVFLGELIWREFAAYLLWHHPSMPEQPLRPRFARLPTRRAPAELRAWQRGRTGIPVVDAGMRQLWRTGWMHNRVRMIAASFLVKHLLMPFRAGEDWFWDTLVDADLATNAASWQWVAGSGIDSQPFFRIFNPVFQGQKFDPDGAYVRAWVPELARLPARWLHAPWTAPAAALAAAGVTLGQTYPSPVIDLVQGRARALAAYRGAVQDGAGDEAAA